LLQKALKTSLNVLPNDSISVCKSFELYFTLKPLPKSMYCTVSISSTIEKINSAARINMSESIISEPLMKAVSQPFLVATVVSMEYSLTLEAAVTGGVSPKSLLMMHGLVTFITLTVMWITTLTVKQLVFLYAVLKTEFRQINR